MKIVFADIFGFFFAVAVATHPNMKSVVVLEVERLLYRPNIAAKAQ